MIDLGETFEKFTADFIRFERIQDPPSRRPDLCAFLLLDKLAPWVEEDGAPDILVSAKHDEVWLSINPEKLAAAATEDDILYLVRCGVRWDDDVESLAMFV